MIGATWLRLAISGKYKLRDVWTCIDVEIFNAPISAAIDAEKSNYSN